MNNPLMFIDPNGMDTIHTNSYGYVRVVVQADGPHVVMVNGVQYDFNDPEIDYDQLLESILPDDRYNWDYSKDQVRMFVPISDGNIMKYMLESGTHINYVLISSPISTTNLAMRYFLGWYKDSRQYDFALTLYKEFAKKNFLMVDNGIFRKSIQDGTGGFYVFGNHIYIYNLSDAGNFLTGKAYNMAGYDKWEIKTGAHLNELLSLPPKFDSKSDQRAISSGYDYKLKKEWIIKLKNMLFYLLY